MLRCAMAVAEVWGAVAECFRHVLQGSDADRKAAEAHLNALQAKDGIYMISFEHAFNKLATEI